MRYSKKKINEQTRMPSLKYIYLEKGTKLNFEDIIEGEFEQNGRKVLNDAIKTVKNDGSAVKLPVREFLKMNISGGGKHYQGETGSDDVKFPRSITIVDSKDRVSTTDGSPVYPIFSYEGADDFLAPGSNMTWEELVKTGIKKDNTFKPVQDYTIEVEH